MAEINKINLRAVTRLIEAGVTNEKEIGALRLKEILSIPGITKAEMEAISELQEVGKTPSIMAFLAMPEKKEEKTAAGGEEDEDGT